MIAALKLIPFFGRHSCCRKFDPEYVEAYRARRRKDDGKSTILQTINNDHIILKRG